MSPGRYAWDALLVEQRRGAVVTRTVIADHVRTAAKGDSRRRAGRELIQVDPQELLHRAGQLEGIAEDLRFSHQRIEGLRASEIGAKDIDRGLDHMADRWRYGLMKLAESAEHTAGALREAGRRYSDVESSVASGFGGR